VGTTNENPSADPKTRTGSKIQGEGDHKAAREYDADTRNFIETHDVTKVARNAAPGSGEESADLLQAEQVSNTSSKAGA
jgi:hypothetical protein